MGRKGRKLSLTAQIALGLALGVGAGIGLQAAVWVAEDYIGVLGTMYLNLIRFIVVPVVTLSIIQGVISLGDVKKVGKIGGASVAFFLCTTAVAVTVGLAVANLIGVGEGMAPPAQGSPGAGGQTLKITDTFLAMVPDNILSPFVQASMLQVIVASLLLGFGILGAGAKGERAARAVDSLAQVSFRIMDMILRLSPVGVFALICPVVARQGLGVLLPMLQVVLAAYLAYGVHILVLYSTCVAVFARVSPLGFFRQLGRPMVFAFSSASSVGTLPFNLEAAERLGVSREVSGFVLPLGATINMDGTAIYQGVCAVLIAKIYGLDLSLTQQLTVVLTAVLASIGTAGVPSSGMVMLAMVLQSVGLPVGGIALVAGIDRVLDMGRTVVNITGDAACALCVNALMKKPSCKQEGTECGETPKPSK